MTEHIRAKKNSLCTVHEKSCYMNASVSTKIIDIMLISPARASMATWQLGQCCTACYDSKAATAIQQKLEAWELELDYRMAMVRFREEHIKELEKRISELEGTEQMHGQEKADNEE